MANGLTVYLHFPCFDGIVSATLASEYLRKKKGWVRSEVVPVGYSERNGWASSSLSSPAAVVDFLYHPDADFWADHHETSFITAELKTKWQKRKSAITFFDPKALSCASVIWRNTHRTIWQSRFREMVQWANRIDGAKYDSVKDAVLGDAPALRINLSFMSDSSPEYCQFLLDSFSTKSLESIAASSEVRERYQRARKGIQIGQARFSKSSRLERDGVVVFDVESSETITLSRYAPYMEYPKALYSVGILKSSDGTKITAMRNPWRHFKSVPLGQIFNRYGGGGHQRVASVIIKDTKDAEQTLQAILADLRKARFSKISLEKDGAVG
ncbi:MAG TPA: hypothetical protein VGN16_22040 [Acidobacteriaceae bacterium]|jgi:hypothetical protein